MRNDVCAAPGLSTSTTVVPFAPPDVLVAGAGEDESGRGEDRSDLRVLDAGAFVAGCVAERDLPGQAVDMGPQGKVRMFRGASLKPGLIATLAIKGITAAPAEPETAAVATPSSKFSITNLALAAAFLMILVGAGMIFAKKPQPKKA